MEKDERTWGWKHKGQRKDARGKRKNAKRATKRLEEYQAKLDQVHQMQLKQTAWMDKMEARERGLGQSQSFGWKPTERGLKKSPGEKKAVLVANTDSKRFEKKPQEEKKHDEESAYEYVTEEEYSAEESSSSEDTHVDPAIGKVDFTDLWGLKKSLSCFLSWKKWWEFSKEVWNKAF